MFRLWHYVGVGGIGISGFQPYIGVGGMTVGGEADIGTTFKYTEWQYDAGR